MELPNDEIILAAPADADDLKIFVVDVGLRPAAQRAIGHLRAARWLSIFFHVSVLAAFEILAESLPPMLAVRQGRASIDLQASIAAAPKSAEEETPIEIEPERPKPPPPKPPLAGTKPQETVVERKPTEPLVERPDADEPEQLALADEPMKLAREEPEPPPPEPTPPVKKRPKQPPLPPLPDAPTVSQASIASQAEEGSEVDEQPRARFQNRNPRYPSDAFSRGQQGVVILRLRIDRSGLVTEATVQQSSGVPSLDAAAVEAAESWRYEPARRRGVAVDYVVDAPVRFSIRS